MALIVKDGNGTNQNLPLYDPSYGFGGLAFTPVAAPTDWLIIQGSATKVVRLKRVEITGFATTAGSLEFRLRKASDAGTIGSGVLTAITACPMDSAYAAATAVVSTVGTANYTTVPAIVGSAIKTSRLFLDVETTGESDKLVWEWAGNGDKPPALRASTEYLCLNSNGDGLPAGTKFDWSIILEEGEAV